MAKWQRSVVVSVLAVLALGFGARLVQAEEAKELTEGKVSGVLTAKGETWIEVKADGAKEAVRYTPRWIGGNPSDGGGLDEAMVKAIRVLVVPNRVTLTWKFEERPRVLSITSGKPEKTSGETAGVVVGKGETWLEVKDAAGATQRYTPRWIGGNPSDGGGLDEAMVKAIREVEVGAQVTVRWQYDERLRVVGLSK